MHKQSIMSWLVLIILVSLFCYSDSEIGFCMDLKEGTIAAKDTIQRNYIMYNANNSTTLPTWGANHTKIVMKSINGEMVGFAVALYDGSSPFTVGIYRKRGEASWIGIWSGSVHQPPCLILDNANRLHALYTNSSAYLTHIRFDDPVNSSSYVTIDTTPILNGAPTNGYFGAAYDDINNAIYVAFSDTSWTLRCALYTTAWNNAETVGSYAGHAYLYPCVEVHGGIIHVMAGRYLLGTSPNIYDGISKFTRSGSWSGTTIAEAPSATGIALYGCDLVETDTAGEVIGLVYCCQELGGPRPTGVYVVRPEQNWMLDQGLLVGTTPGFDPLSNLYVEPSGRIWVIGTYPGQVLRYSYSTDKGLTWNGPFAVDDPSSTLSGAAVTVKRKSGADWLNQMIACYSTDYSFTGSNFRSVMEVRIGFTTPTPTVSPTVTPSPTATQTPTETPTGTLSPSETPTYSPTATLSPTDSPTNSPTATLTPSISPTSSPTDTFTPTNTPTDSPTRTLTPTQTPSNTSTMAVSPTQSPTSTPTETATSTNSPTYSPTFSPTDSPTVTLSPTQTATYSPTETYSPTSSPTVIPTDTWTPTLSPTQTATTTPTETIQPTIAPSGTPIATTAPTLSPTATVSVVLPIPTIETSGIAVLIATLSFLLIVVKSRDRMRATNSGENRGIV